MTLLELLMVMVIMSVLAAIAAPKVTSVISRTRLDAASQKIFADVRYAQSLAMSKRTRTWVVFDDVDDRYSVYKGADKASRSLAVDPLTRDVFTINLSDEYPGVTITGVDFGGIAEVQFDSLGTSYDGDGNLLAVAGGYVELNGGISVKVTRNTGRIFVER